MKKQIHLLAAITIALLFSVPSYSQDNVCESGYMPLKKGISFEQTHYDKKQKETSKTVQKIVDVVDISGGIKATSEIKTLDAKGKALNEGKYSFECRNNTIYVDMSSMLDPRSMAGFENMEMEISGDALELPANLSVGQSLKDGMMNIKVGTGGMTLMNMSLNITGRKVEASEKVTTSAGTFDCVKITQEMEFKTMMKRKFKSSSWYAKGIGMVKTENYDSKGAVESSSLLTKFDR